MCFERIYKIDVLGNYYLCVREGYWVKELGAKLNTYQPGRTNKQYREDTIDQKKKYREEHKEHASAIAKKRYEITRDSKIEYNKTYRQDNKGKLAARDAENFVCECGGHYSRQAKAHHFKTTKHLTYFNQMRSRGPTITQHQVNLRRFVYIPLGRTCTAMKSIVRAAKSP
jgi:hypothetical protein